MTTTTRTQGAEVKSARAGAQFLFGSINEPGAYVCNWNGHLIRMPEEALKPGHSPLLNILSKESLYVTKISDDPFIPVLKARLIAADTDLEVNF